MSVRPPLPAWNPPDTVVQEPASGKKNTGWGTEPAPSQAFNWFWRLVSRWFAFLDGLASGHPTVQAGYAATPEGSVFSVVNQNAFTGGAVASAGVRHPVDGAVYRTGSAVASQAFTDGAIVLVVGAADDDGDKIVAFGPDGSKLWGVGGSLDTSGGALDVKFTPRFIVVSTRGATNSDVTLIDREGNLVWTVDAGAGFAYVAAQSRRVTSVLGGRVFVGIGTTITERHIENGSVLQTVALAEPVVAMCVWGGRLWYALEAPDGGDILFDRSFILANSPNGHTIPDSYVPDRLIPTRYGVCAVSFRATATTGARLYIVGGGSVLHLGGFTFPATDIARLTSDGRYFAHFRPGDGVTWYDIAGTPVSNMDHIAALPSGTSTDGMHGFHTATSSGNTIVAATAVFAGARQYTPVRQTEGVRPNAPGTSPLITVPL